MAIDQKELEGRRRSERVAQRAWEAQKKMLPMWRELNKAFYPYLYQGLRSDNLKPEDPVQWNTDMIDNVPADALYVLAAGFMNGVTSPARKWIRVKRPGSAPYREEDGGQTEAHSEIQQRLLSILSGSNYYECRAVQTWDAAGLGTSPVLIYEDFDTVVTFVTVAPGTYALITDSLNRITGFVRRIPMKISDVVAEFGESAVSKAMLEKSKRNDQQGMETVQVMHLIEKNADDGLTKFRTKFRELYWLESRAADAPPFLAKRPMHEWPVAVLRWHCPDNTPYGYPDTMKCRGRAVQLQNLEYKSDQGLDKMISPPLLADQSLRNRPTAFQARGITYTNNLNPNSGARPLMQIQIPFAEMDVKRQRIVEGIRESLHNPLFNMISQLDTVRSATEIDARREEKLVQLGPVLQRSYSEDLSVVVNRVYGISRRKGLMPDIPEGEGTEVEFSNILSDVQKASDVSTIERFFAFAGQNAAVFPDVQQSVNAQELLRQYAEGLGIRPNGLRTPEVVEEAQAEQSEMAELTQMSEIARNFAPAAGVAAQGDPGGGLAAVQATL